MFELLGNKIGVIPIHDPDKIGSLYIPTQQVPDNGIVKYVGRDVKYVSIGDHVVFSGYTGTELTIQTPNGQKEHIIVLPEDFVGAKIHDEGSIQVPGLYIKQRNNEYIPATIEIVVDLLHDTVQRNVKWKKPLSVYKNEQRKAI